MTPLAVVGIGGHGRECLDLAEAVIADGADLEIVGVFDDNPTPLNVAHLERRGLGVLGGVDALIRRGTPMAVCIGIGTGRARAAVARSLLDCGFDFPVLRHPDATVGSDVELGPGTALFAGSRLTTNLRLGQHVHVGQNATVGHDCRLEDFVTLYPQAAVSGTVSVGAETTIGASAVVLQGLEIGRESLVGAGACVVRDVPSHVVVKGVPAR